MKIHELTVTANKQPKRVGRGISAGQGKTAGRGTKGQNSRTGGGVRPGFEGGQNPLAKRLPKKRGFVPLNQVKYQVINIVQLENLATGSTVDATVLAAAGYIKHVARPVKLLGTGKLTKKLTITVDAASASAIKMVEAAGGAVTVVARKAPAADRS
jgi:large subunit ribosomal protein L15